MRKKTDSDDLVNEKLTRENAENVLRAAREELRNQAVSARDAEHLLNRLVQDANGMQQQQAKLMAILASQKETKVFIGHFLCQQPLTINATSFDKQNGLS